jgi:C-terminal processing protease CtpA/Prc
MCISAFKGRWNQMSSVRVFVVQIKRHYRYGLGLGVWSEAGKVCIVRLVPLGPADLTGRLRVGDELLSVNGNLLPGVDQLTAVSMLRADPGHVMLAVRRPITRVCLRRFADTHYGFQLRVGSKQALIVQHIVPGSLAAASRLQAGDQLDVINGACCAGMSKPTAIERLRTSELVLLITPAATV